MKALIVDDDRDHGESIAEVLEMRGHAVEIAYTGEDAVDCFRAGDFDLVLMDVKLPRMNGVEAFHACKAIRPNARVMMMTGYSVEQLVGEALNDGALGVLHKPFAVARLLELLEQIKPRSRVLVAECDDAFTAGVAPILTDAGYSVDIAVTADAAMTRLDKAGADCLILGLCLLENSARDTQARLIEAGRRIPTILVSGDGDPDRQEKIEQLRPITRGMLVKPFEPGTLLKAVGAAISAAAILSAVAIA